MAKKLKVTPIDNWSDAVRAKVELKKDKFVTVPILRIDSTPAELYVRRDQYTSGVVILTGAGSDLDPKADEAELYRVGPQADDDILKEVNDEEGLKKIGTVPIGQEGFKPNTIVVALFEEILQAHETNE